MRSTDTYYAMSRRRGTAPRRDTMSTQERYARPPGDTEWIVKQGFDTTFRWEYEDGRDKLLKLYEKFDIGFPINPYLQHLPEPALAESRWDFTYLGMQVLIEGVALASFGLIRDQAQNPLAASVNAYVMQDEARHVAFGRLALRDYYPQLTQAERDEREEFAVEACYAMRDRFQAEEVWATLGLPVAEGAAYMKDSDFMRRYRSELFTRIVPAMKDIGLWGEKIRHAYSQMGILGFADTDLHALADHDEKVAEDFDARKAELASVARSVA